MDNKTRDVAFTSGYLADNSKFLQCAVSSQSLQRHIVRHLVLDHCCCILDIYCFACWRLAT